jgi:hypothetical protein
MTSAELVQPSKVQRKKAQERILVEQFLERATGFETSLTDFESPDFIVIDTHGALGLEVTRLFKDAGKRGSPKKTAEILRQHSLDAVARAYYKSNGLPLLVSAIIRGPSLRAPEGLAEIMNLLRPAKEWDQAEFETPGGSKLFLTSLPSEVGRYPHWRCVNNSVGWVNRQAEEIVSAVIRTKALNLKSYRSRIQRVGLLLVAEIMNDSGMLELQGLDPFQHEGFDAVYLYRYPFEIVRLC